MMRNILSQCSKGVTLADHVELMEEIIQNFPSDISRLHSTYPLYSYTCVPYALKLVADKQYEFIRGLPPRNVFAGKDFVEWLIRKGYLIEIAQETVQIGDWVIYSDDCGVFTHIGAFRAQGLVASKWGDLGLYEHKTFFVPSEYGINLKCYRSEPKEVTLAWFLEYAREFGIELA